MNSFYHDSTGIDPDEKFELLPENKWFPFQISEAVAKVTQTGKNMVSFKAEVIQDQKWKGKWVFHNVVFMEAGEKGAGISVHFRKCIEEPFGKNDLVTPANWNGKRFMGKVGIREYNGKRYNQINEVSPYGVNKNPETTEAIEAMKEDSDIPF